MADDQSAPEDEFWNAAQADFDKFFNGAVMALLDQRRFGEACDRLEERLATESDEHVRSWIIGHLIHFRQIEGRVADSYAWAVRGTEERPDDPMAWNSRATWHLYPCHARPPSPEELAEGLRCSARAVALALESDAWVRNVLFDRGRIANAAGRWDIIEEVMRALIEDAPKTRESDIPMIETDYLDGLPPGAVDPELRARFFAAMRTAVRIDLPMRDEPEAFEE